MREAVELFEPNVAACPQSANAYDSLGGAYMEGGGRESAIKNYQRSPGLNPQNANAAERLKRLGEK